MIENSVDNLDNNSTLFKIDAYEGQISYEEALEVSNELIESVIVYFETYHDVENDYDIAIENFWQRNYTLSESINSSLELDGLDKIVAVDFDYHIELSDIQELDFLSEIQKQYAIDLLEATKTDDFTKLVDLKNNFKQDIRNHPELSIYNTGIALIEASELYFLNNPVIPLGSCVQAALNGAIMAGVAGMIVGAINGGIYGGIYGAVAGLIFSGGTLSVPVGGSGAVIGSIWGAITGFVGGFALTYIGCLIFGT